LELMTMLAPGFLMEQLLEIEQMAGRQRREKYGPRTIDIDILFFNDDIISTPLLTVPHPHIALRRFVLEPMNELAPAYIHPVLRKSIAQLLDDCPDPLPVKKFSLV